jgi:P2 family phage contractile tail tube protein
MGLPRKLVNLNTYVNGTDYRGVISEFEQPKLAESTNDYRGGGMPGTIKQKNGLEAMEATLTFGGNEPALTRLFAQDDTRIRLICAYQSKSSSIPQSVDIFLRGSFNEIDFGKDKPGEPTEHKYKADLTYYRREVDGVVEVEIDMINGIYSVGGVDRYAEIMAILAG